LRLLLRFNLAFLPLIAVSFCGAGYIFRQQFRRTAEEEVLEDARVMMQTARASRVYTTSQIAPLLDHEQSRVYQAIESVHQMLDEHLPAVLRKAIDRLPSQRGKQVTPDRAIEWEADFVNLFIKTPGKTEFFGHRETPLGTSLLADNICDDTNDIGLAMSEEHYSLG
jgi:hypothetical protein